VLARSAVGGEGNVAGSILALVIITVIVGAATIVLYRRSA
jgi:hypothetical protein